MGSRIEEKEEFMIPFFTKVMTGYRKETYDFIRLIISLSTGSIALMTILLRYLIEDPGYIELLWISSICFVLAILLGVISFNMWRTKGIEVLQKVFEAYDRRKKRTDEKTDIDMYKLNVLLRILSGFFILGICSLFLFIALNMF